MKVVIIHSRYQSGSTSGENRVVEDEESLLRQAGHDVHVWMPSVPESGSIGRVRTGAAAVWSASAKSTVEQLVQRHHPDVVHCHNLFPALSPSVLRAADGVPIVVTLHNYRLLCLPGTFLREGRICESCLGHAPWRGIVHRCYHDSMAASGAIATSVSVHRAARTFSRPDMYLAVSTFVRDKHVEAGFSPERIKVKPNFAWPTARREGAGEYFLFLGRLTAEKGLDSLFAAFDRLQGVPLVVVGDGPDASRLKSVAPSGVEFRGALDPSELAGIFRGARALVFPSIWYEGAPRVIIEAYAAGVPVLASRIGGVPELIAEERSGLLVEPGDTEAWSSAIERLLDDAESLRLGEGAWSLWNEGFRPEHGLENLESAYRDVVGDERVTGTTRTGFGRER